MLFRTLPLSLVFVAVGIMIAGAGLAQDDAPPQHLGAPVQTVVDAVPRVVSLAVSEAERDGTPDQAEALVATMQAFVVGFDSGGAWPEGSAAAEWPTDAWLRYAVSVADLAAEIPGQVAAVERTDARCASWYANATVGDVEKWGRDVRRADLAVSALLGALDDLVAAVPPVVEARPLVVARERLAEWQAGTGPRVVDCVVRAEEDRGLDAERVVSLRVVPERTWPLGEVLILGGVSGAGGAAVDLTSSLGIARSLVTGADGSFRVAHMVPLDAPLGATKLRAVAGDLNASASLEIVRIPTRVLLEGPRAVTPGEAFSFTVHVLPVVPAGAPPGNVTLSGNISGSHALVSGTATSSHVAPLEDGAIAALVRYPGSERFAGAEARYAVRVGSDAAVVARFVPDEEPGFAVDRNVLLVAAALALMTLVVLVVLPRLLRRRAPPPGVPWAAETPPPLPTSGPLVRVFAIFHAWAVRLGVASRGDTPREMAAKIGDPQVVQGVREFERVRYGGEPERPERTAQVGSWLHRVWLRMTGK